jgi:hypothetical protein
MGKRVPFQVWLQAGLGMASAAFAALTLVSREWIEAVFGVDPDHGSGAAEWAVVAALAVVAIWCGIRAARSWRGVRPARS